MKYLIGLGNPGKEYDGTRHNIGRMCLTELAAAGEFSAFEHHKPSQSLRARGTNGGELVELVLPETFMNKSGETVKFLIEKEGAAVTDILVLHDEIDVPFGELKVSVGRGDGGNNGIKSIIAQLGTKDFARLRIGVGSKPLLGAKARRPAGAALERFVLGKFSLFERPKLPALYKTVQEATETFVRDGVTKAMNRYN
ncbi:aminoacyl-tRNA hydrolase [Candidatus Kaiserbacteria bacterium]|nr:aminoacyl-tRNA hydrolase [Candidatus Kaiserbacteria bacterium]